MLALVPNQYYPAGPFVINNYSGRSELSNGSRRVTRSKLLDGTATVFDGGYTDGDRIIDVTINAPSAAQISAFRTIFEGYQILKFSSVDGQYLVSPSDYQVSGNTLKFTLLIISKTSG